MPIVLKCGKCQGRFKTPDSMAGKRIRCKCGTVLAVPGVKPVVAPKPVIPVAPKIDALEVSDLSGLIYGDEPTASACPGCTAPIAADAVICTACGFNLKTGQRMSVRIEEDAPAAVPIKGKRKAKAEKAPKPVKVVTDGGGSGAGAAVGKIIKIVLVLGLLAGLGYGGMLIKEAVTLDPKKQSQDALKKITNGMTIAQVVTTMEGPPKEVLAPQETPKGLEDKRIGYADNFLKHHGPKKLQYGFTFVYLFSERDQLHIEFTPNGIVTGSELFDPMKALGL